jgi:hypothetical protein
MEETNRTSSLFLAILLHVNVFVSSVYAFVIGALILEKRFYYQSSSTPLYPNVLPTIYLIFVAGEFVRLRMGAQANLEESVSHLAASMVICIFPQIPALIYMGYLQEHIYLADRWFSIFIFVGITLEFVVSFSVLRKMIRVKTIEYYRALRQEQMRSREDQMKQNADVVYWSRKKSGLSIQQNKLEGCVG